MADDEYELDKPVMLFGRDVRKIPCFRSSCLYGIGGGFVGGLIVFMLTSKPHLASHCMVGAFSCVTLGSWVVCRHNWAYQKFSIGQIHGAVRRTVREDKTEQEQNVKDLEVVDV